MGARAPAAGVALLSMGLGLAVVTISLLTAGEAVGAVVQISVVGMLALVVGVVVGLPVVATLGVVGLAVAQLTSIGSAEVAFDHRVVILAPMLWATFETAMRSFELRPPVDVSRAAALDWLGVLVTLGGGTVAVALVAGVAVDAAPDGGLTFRVAAAVVVVVAVVGLAVADLSGRRAGRARG